MDIENENLTFTTTKLKEKLWCSVCDFNSVNPKDKTTGTCFLMCCNEYIPPKDWKEDGKIGEWKEIVFAICSTCLKK
jgi:hypothetical protein